MKLVEKEKNLENWISKYEEIQSSETTRFLKVNLTLNGKVIFLTKITNIINQRGKEKSGK